MIEQTHKAYKYGAPAPIELTIWSMAEVFGWTLEYINSLPMSRLQEWASIEEGKTLARGK